MSEGVGVEVNEQLIQQQLRAFAQLMVDNPDTRKRIRKIVREELKDAAKRLREDARYEMKSDPRKAYRAVKSSIYRRILGGNVSILNPKRAGARYMLLKDRKLDNNPYQRGGNRRRRTARTDSIDSYYGRDRAFILRFVNSGTQTRRTRYGNRGAIAPRNWFGNMAPHEVELAAGNLAEVIDDELAEAYKEVIKQ
jgi:hypothetical protein